MTLTATLDTTNALVHLEATALGAADAALVERSTDLVAWTTVRGGAYVAPANWRIVTDAFGRTVASGWGNADTGQAYTNTGGAAADFSVSGGLGRHSLTSVNVTRQSLLSTLNLRDVESVVTVTVSATALTQTINARIHSRFVNASNLWSVKLEFDTTGNVDVGLNKIVGGVSTFPANVANVVAYTPGSNVNVRSRLVGDNIKVKVWAGALSAEPGPWTIDYTEAVAGITSGAVALASDLTTGNTNTLPVTVTFDDLAVDEVKVVLDDYEYVPGKLNTYRVRGIETAAISLVGVGAGATANNANVVPALPTGLATGDAMFLLASIRNSGAGTVNLPAGWTSIATSGNVSLFGRKYVAGDIAPTVTFTGGVANADTIGQIAAFRRADIAPIANPVAQLNGSAQNISFPSQTIGADRALVLVAGWKQDDFTSVATLAGGFAEIAEVSTTTGDDASQVWDYLVQTLKAAVSAGSFTVTGGAAAISRGLFAHFPHSAFLNEQTTSITPTLDRVWLKSPARPFLNRVVTVVDWSDPARSARSSDNDVVGRSLPIAVTDVRGSKRFTLFLYAATHADAQTLDFIIASGDVLFLHTPLDCEVPGGYLRVDTTGERRPRKRAASRVFGLPVVQCAAPGPDIVAAVGTWASVLANFATWQDVLNAFPTWADLLAYHGSPSEVIVQ